MKGLVFFDLDGTLLNHHSDVEDDVIFAIEALKKQGYEPFLATGRTPAEVLSIMEKTKIHSGVFMNGQLVIFQGKVAVEHRIPQERVAAFHALAKQQGDGLAAYNETEFKVVEYSPLTAQTYAHVHSPVPETNEHFYNEQPVSMLLLMSPPEHDELYSDAFPDLDFFRNTPFSIDVVSKGISKAKGIQELMSYLHDDSLVTYAFGDEANDLPMFDVVDFPIAMGNAIPELKAKAAFITTANIDHGIVNGLNHYHLLGDETIEHL